MSESVVSVLDAKIEETEQELAQITERAEKLEDVLMNLRTAREILGDAEGVKPPPVTKKKEGKAKKPPLRKPPGGPSRGHRKGGKKAGRAGSSGRERGDRPGPSDGRRPPPAGETGDACGRAGDGGCRGELVRESCADCSFVVARCGGHNTGRGSAAGLVNRHRSVVHGAVG